jgi:hypothetical protein
MGSEFLNPPPVPAGEPVSADDRTWGMIAHLSSLIAWLIGLPFLGPLMVWILKKDQSAFVGDQAKEALNFQIAVMIVSLICSITCVGLLLLPVIAIADLILSIMAAMEANKGVYYRYPYSIRLIK